MKELYMIKLNNKKLSEVNLKNAQDIIQKNIELLNKCEFKKLYDAIYKLIEESHYDVRVGDLTYIFVSAGIDPLMYMDEIPVQYFMNNDNLISIDIPNNIKSIGDSAFKACSGLTNIVIPDSVKSIGKAAFGNCRSLKSVIIGNGVDYISKDAFIWCDKLTTVVIGDNVKWIGDSAFHACKSLKNIELPDSIEEIGVAAFGNCKSLTSIKYLGLKKDALLKLNGKNKRWRDWSKIKKIICTDGSINL